MRPQRQRFRILGTEPGNEFTPQQTAGAQLGDLHEEIHSDAPEERQPGRELVDVQARIQAGLQVIDAVGQRIGQLEIGCGTGLLDVVAGDRNRIELRHLGAGEGEDVGDDSHRRLRRIDVGVADHELFENVVLNGPGQFLRRYTLFLSSHHVEREDREHCTVHRHRDRHAPQVDTGEELSHIQNRVDRHPRHTDIALHARVVRVVPAVGGQIECHRQTLLSGREVAPVERVGISCGGESGVLADSPRLIHVHGGVGPTDEGRLTGEAVERVTRGYDGVPIGSDVERLHHDAFGGVPVQLLRRVAMSSSRGGDVLIGGGSRWCRRRLSAPQWYVGETGDGARGDLGRRYLGHVPSPFSSTESASTASILAVR